jgi:four helix bundle protein
MNQIKSYRDLFVWQKSIELVTQIYIITQVLPVEEKFSLANQIKRAAISVPSNIAEGYSRTSSIDYKRYLSIALGSVYEVQTQLIICRNLGFISDKSKYDLIWSISEEIIRMLSSLRTKLSLK